MAFNTNNNQNYNEISPIVLTKYNMETDDGPIKFTMGYVGTTIYFRLTSTTDDSTTDNIKFEIDLSKSLSCYFTASEIYAFYLMCRDFYETSTLSPEIVGKKIKTLDNVSIVNRKRTNAVIFGKYNQMDRYYIELRSLDKNGNIVANGYYDFNIEPIDTGVNMKEDNFSYKSIDVNYDVSMFIDTLRHISTDGIHLQSLGRILAYKINNPKSSSESTSNNTASKFSSQRNKKPTRKPKAEEIDDINELEETLDD